MTDLSQCTKYSEQESLNSRTEKKEVSLLFKETSRVLHLLIQEKPQC